MPTMGKPFHIELPGAVQVPMRLVDGRPTVQARVNGKGPFTFGIETGGAFTVVVNPRLAQALRTREPNAAPSTPGADTLQLGGMTITDLDVAASSGVRGGVRGLDGLLGLPLFKDVALTVDFIGMKVRIDRDTLPTPNGADVLPLLRTGPITGVEGRIGGRPVTLTIDTQGGGTGLICSPQLGERMTFQAPLAVLGQARIGGFDAAPVTTYAARLVGDAQVGGITLKEPIISTIPLPPELGCLLGLDFLHSVSVTLDQRSMRARFSGPAVIPRQPSLFVTGLVAEPDSSGVFHITAMRAGSAAEASGLQAGDEVVDIAGKPATLETLAPSAIRALSEERRPISMTIRRRGERIAVTVTPKLLVQ